MGPRGKKRKGTGVYRKSKKQNRITNLSSFGSEVDLEPDSSDLFQDADPDFAALQEKNVKSSKARALTKHVKTQKNKWQRLYGSMPTVPTFVDKNLAKFVAATFDEHPNPAQFKQITTFLKHQAIELGLINPMARQERTRYPLLQEQMEGIKACKEFKSHVPEKAEVFSAWEYTFGLRLLVQRYHAAKHKPAAALHLASWFLHFDGVNRPGAVKQMPVLRFAA
jgi:hypothetical protein